MQVHLVMTVIGPDRTGLVEALARVVAEQGGNWLESRMCRLGGEFAGILRIALPLEKRQRLAEALQALQASGLTVVLRPGDVPAPAKADRSVRLEIVGHDRPGIVQQVTGLLAQAEVNVEEFSSQCVSAPMSGETLFQATACLRLPQGCDRGALQRELEKIAADLLVEISLAELTGDV